MRVECFEIKRCCCCVPLRYGLLVLGYLKLAISLLVLLPLFFGNVDLPPASAMSRLQYVGVLAILGLCVVVVLGDLALTIVFVVGGHKKCPKLLRVYNYYSITMLIIYVSAYILFDGYQMYYLIQRFGLIYSSLLLRTPLTIGALNIGFQVYIILITKAEIAKLKNNHQIIEFSNTANEAQCTINDEGNIIENGDKNIEQKNGVCNGNDTGTYVKNIEPEYQIYNENEENDRTQKKLNGNYVKLV